MDPFARLSEDNHDQITQYLKFLRVKKDSTLRGMTRDVRDMKSDRLQDDMYSREEVDDFVDHLSSQINVCLHFMKWLFHIQTQ